MKLYVFSANGWNVSYIVMSQTPAKAVASVATYLGSRDTPPDVKHAYQIQYLAWKNAAPKNLPPLYVGSKTRYELKELRENEVLLTDSE